MQENTKVMATLGLAGLVLALMGVGVWVALRDDEPRTPEATINPFEELTGGQIDMATHAVGATGIIDSGIERFRLRMGRFPNTLSELVEPPQDSGAADHWRGPYINNPHLLDDPWGNPYRIRVPGVHNVDRYDLWSAGPDGRDDTSDDIGNW